MSRLLIAATLIPCLYFAVLSGCTAERLAHDHETLKDQLQKLQDDDLFENVVAAYRGDNLLIVNYGDLSGTSKTTITSKGGWTGNEDDNLVGNSPDNTTIIEIDKDGGNVSVETQLYNELSMKGTPVLNNRYPYEKIREYARFYLRASATLPVSYHRVMATTPRPGEAQRLLEEGRLVGEPRANQHIYFYVPQQQCAIKAYSTLADEAALFQEPKLQTHETRNVVVESGELASTSAQNFLAFKVKIKQVLPEAHSGKMKVICRESPGEAEPGKEAQLFFELIESEISANDSAESTTVLVGVNTNDVRCCLEWTSEIKTEKIIQHLEDQFKHCGIAEFILPASEKIISDPVDGVIRKIKSAWNGSS